MQLIEKVILIGLVVVVLGSIYLGLDALKQSAKVDKVKIIQELIQ